MKTTVVPAQITTVEDRIAGNMTFTQIVMLVIPLITGTTIYVLLPPHNHFSIIKVILIAMQFAFFGTLAIRVRGKILVDWMVIFLRFRMRPRIYLYTKNDIAGRSNIDEIIVEKEQINSETIEEKEVIRHKKLSLKDQIKIERLFNNPSYSFRFNLTRKGGIDVSIASDD